MSNHNHRSKLQMTVRLTPELFKAAQQAARSKGAPVSHVVVDAARQTLLPAPEQSPQAVMQHASHRQLQRMEAMERNLMRELLAIKELIALLTRNFFNLTRDVPAEERTLASIHGRKRFSKLVELMRRNLRDGTSVLDDVEENHGNGQDNTEQ